MELSVKRTLFSISFMLLALVITQAIYTYMYAKGLSESIPRNILWGSEALLFSLLAAFAGAMLVRDTDRSLAWAALAFGSIINVVQISVGLIMFGPIFEAAGQVDALMPVANGFVALSFMMYFAGKFLLGVAAVIFGLGHFFKGSKALGGLTILVGVVAILSNAVLTMYGFNAFIPSGVGGTSGALAALLLAVLTFKQAKTI